MEILEILAVGWYRRAPVSRRAYAVRPYTNSRFRLG